MLRSEGERERAIAEGFCGNVFLVIIKAGSSIVVCNKI
jgi:hypothetical protein